jgi:hypothetical protein
MIAKILKDAGYEVVEGYEAVKEILSERHDHDNKLCSGYGVFPDGEKCEGCIDCLRKNHEIR